MLGQLLDEGAQRQAAAAPSNVPLSEDLHLSLTTRSNPSAPTPLHTPLCVAQQEGQHDASMAARHMLARGERRVWRWMESRSQLAAAESHTAGRREGAREAQQEKEQQEQWRLQGPLSLLVPLGDALSSSAEELVQLAIVLIHLYQRLKLLPGAQEGVAATIQLEELGIDCSLATDAP